MTEQAGFYVGDDGLGTHVGRISTGPTYPYDYPTDGDGMVTLAANDDPNPDPPWPRVYVEDLPDGTSGSGTHSYFVYLWGGLVASNPWTPAVDGVYSHALMPPDYSGSPSPVRQVANGTGSNDIRLDTPTAITGAFKARWKVRFSYTLDGRPLWRTDYKVYRHAYARDEFFSQQWHYGYFLTQIMRDLGWQEQYSADFEYLNVGGGMWSEWDYVAWSMDFRGENRVQLYFQDPYGAPEAGSVSLLVEANTWYIVEMDAFQAEPEVGEGEVWNSQVTVSPADGDEPSEVTLAVIRKQLVPPQMKYPRQGNDGVVTVESSQLTSESADFTMDDIGREIDIGINPPIPCTIVSVIDEQTIEYWPINEAVIASPFWYIPGIGPQVLNFGMRCYLYHDEPWHVDLDWVKVYGRGAMVGDGYIDDPTMIREGWVTESVPILTSMSLRYFETTATPARGTLNVYGMTGELLDPADDWDYLSDADSTRFRMNRTDIDMVEVTYLNNPPSLRVRQTTPRISDPNYAHSHQIRDDNDIRGF